MSLTPVAGRRQKQHRHQVRILWQNGVPLLWCSVKIWRHLGVDHLILVQAEPGHVVICATAEEDGAMRVGRLNNSISAKGFLDRAEVEEAEEYPAFVLGTTKRGRETVPALHIWPQQAAV